MPFTKADLLYSYSWEHTGSDDPKLTGEPDRDLFNRSEGYEVLYLIKRIMSTRGLDGTASGQKIEKMIRLHPGNLRSQAHVKEWINNNWSSY
ncbi:hypothetical protein KXD93_22235 [Mucilaginibacter sp. BJC16-A38]|uniref:hypothetical protein n=1 Tax=Mucilaginibacter phenanthrenivorans TaxID=1234842 RepID=UPI002157D41D|nr:hypothetical protein [Mucilaginibacter phenanthrenivorans]MCR8560389.1 hypothetical protein [Mucilaginibacter phenanthrenivorans]